MDLQIETTSFLSNHDTHISRRDDYLITYSRSSIKADLSSELSEDDYMNGEMKIEEVGYILSYRMNLDYYENNLAFLADLLSSSLCHVASFFFYEQGQGCLSSQYLFYIDEVFITPKYRGLGYGINALAMYLDGYASEEAVCCHPCPIFDLENRYAEEKGKRLMRKYWSKVGLKNFAKEQNILWTANWFMPAWIRHQLFTED